MCILATLHPDYYNKLVRHSKDVRFTITDDEKKMESIQLTEKWAEVFQQYP